MTETNQPGAHQLENLTTWPGTQVRSVAWRLQTCNIGSLHIVRTTVAFG